MTDEEKETAAAFLKLQEDVKKIIIDTVNEELRNYGSPFHANIKGALLNSYDMNEKIKQVIKYQMDKY